MKGQDRLSVVTIMMNWLNHTHIGVSNEDCIVKERVNLNSFRAILQQGLHSGGRLAGGKKSVHWFEDFFWLVCDDWLYWELDVLRFVWDCYMVSMIHNIWYLGC